MAKNNKEDIILNALLTYPTIREVSEATGIAEPTIYLKLRGEEFKTKYNEAKKQILENTVTFLQTKLQQATATILNIMNDIEVAPQVRLNAARSVFDYCIKLTEQTEILERIEALEMKQRDDKNNSN